MRVNQPIKINQKERKEGYFSRGLGELDSDCSVDIVFVSNRCTSTVRRCVSRKRQMCWGRERCVGEEIDVLGKG